MSIPAERFATYEGFRQVPDHKVAQIIHGQLIVMPRPAPKHALASSSLGGSLFPHEGRWQLERAFKAAEEVCAPPFQAVSFSLDSLWP